MNGTYDGLMLIEDSILMMEYGNPNEARFFMGRAHISELVATDGVFLDGAGNRDSIVII